MEPNEQPAIVEITCIEVRAFSVDYVEGDLSLEGYIRIDAHLERCPHCYSVYAGLRNVIDLLSCDELFPIPDGFADRIFRTVIGSSGQQ